MGKMPMPREEEDMGRVPAKREVTPCYLGGRRADHPGEAAERSEGKPAVVTPRGAFISLKHLPPS
jgi:hypothetical protein